MHTQRVSRSFAVAAKAAITWKFGITGRESPAISTVDLTFAMSEKPDFEYFLGSFVFQSKIAARTRGQAFDENDLLDGQQRTQAEH